MTAQALTTEESHPAFHQTSSKGHIDYFTQGPVEKLVSDSLAQEEAMWPVLERVISSHILSEPPAVIDWWLLRPSSVAALDSEHVASIWLHINPDLLWDRERQNTAWMQESPVEERMVRNFMCRSLWRNDLVKREAVQLSMAVLQITGAEPLDALVERTIETVGIG